ncbi:MAG: DUF883 domain-containing protein [Gammaproteobacteria bacterium]|nr:DUF883 domain-containing protein [Gammaproteobacteria bacterium]
MVAPTLNEENPMTTEADKLMEDMRAVVEHAEALLHATSGQAGAGISEARARAEDSLKSARARLEAIEDDITGRAREAAKAADRYVRDNPWTAIGVAAGVGVLVGVLIARR